MIIVLYSYSLNYLAFHFLPGFLKIRMNLIIKFDYSNFFSTAKREFWFQKCTVSLDLNKTFTLLAFPKHVGFFFIFIWWVWVNEGFEIPGFILCGLFLLLSCEMWFFDICSNEQLDGFI